MSVLLAVLILAVVQDVVPPPASDRTPVELRVEFRRILEDEGRTLEDLAQKADMEGRTDEARAFRDRIAMTDPPDGPQRFAPLAEFVPSTAATGGELPPPETTLPETDRIRAATVESLLALAARAAEPSVGRYGLAIECLRAVLVRQPNHREARRLIGQVPHDGGWATPQAARNLSDGYVLHDTFGWVQADWIPHLDRGELPGVITDGKPIPWLPADQADALRRDFFRRPWKISTEHFDIATNVPLAEAIAFGRRLEALRDAFVSLFADVLGPENLDIDDRFRDPTLWAKPSTYRHEVWYFAEKSQYVGYFRRLGRDESRSLGYYMPAAEARRLRLDPRSYFFRNNGDALNGLPTLFHEASHQLLFELAGPSRYERNVGQYWIWEGLGTYFETFTPREDGTYEIGGRIGPRLAKARADILESDLAVPIERLVSMSSAQFQDSEAIYTHYAQAMALVVFLMHAEEGRFREGFLDYVSDAYRGRFLPGGTATGLIDRLGLPVSDVKARFLAFLGGEAGEVANQTDRPTIRITPGGNLRIPQVD